jgi:glycerophosphoryl diester phosphodiesterase
MKFSEFAKAYPLVVQMAASAWGLPIPVRSPAAAIGQPGTDTLPQMFPEGPRRDWPAAPSDADDVLFTPQTLTPNLPGRRNAITGLTPTIPPALTTIELMRHPPSDLVQLVAHRGLYQVGGGNVVPENSRASIDNAARYGMAAIEMDIKLTKDDMPVLSHDVSWGKQAQIGRRPLLPYDAERSLYPDSDPKVNALTWDETRTNLKLRYPWPRQHEVSDEVPLNLQQFLDHMKVNKYDMAVMLDIKDPKVAQKCWEVVAKNKDHLGQPRSMSVVFKLHGHHFKTPDDFKKYFNGKLEDGREPDWKHIRTMFTYHIHDLDRGSGPADTLQSLQRHSNPAEAPYFLMAELGIKDPTNNNFGRITAFLDPHDGGKTLRFGTFQPVPDGPNEGYLRMLRPTICCYPLNDWLVRHIKHNDSLRLDTTDIRADSDALMHLSSPRLVTSDAPLKLASTLAGMGLNNMAHYQGDTSPAANKPGYFPQMLSDSQLAVGSLLPTAVNASSSAATGGTPWQRVMGNRAAGGSVSTRTQPPLGELSAAARSTQAQGPLPPYFQPPTSAPAARTAATAFPSRSLTGDLPSPAKSPSYFTPSRTATDLGSAARQFMSQAPVSGARSPAPRAQEPQAVAITATSPTPGGLVARPQQRAAAFTATRTEPTPPAAPQRPGQSRGAAYSGGVTSSSGRAPTQAEVARAEDLRKLNEGLRRSRGL